MVFSVTNDFTAGTETNDADMNKNFEDVEDVINEVDINNIIWETINLLIQEQLEQAIDLIELQLDASITPATHTATFGDFFQTFTFTKGINEWGSFSFTARDKWAKGGKYNFSSLGFECALKTSTSIPNADFEATSDWTLVNSGAQSAISYFTGSSVEGERGVNMGGGVNGSNTGAGDATLSQTVNFDSIDRFKCRIYRVLAKPGSDTVEASVKIGANTIFDITSTSSATTIDVDFDTSGISGNQLIKFFCAKVGTSNTDTYAFMFIDNISTDVSTLYEDTVIQTDSIATGSSNITDVFVSIRGTIPAGTGITYAVSSDGGSTFTTGLALDVKNNITSTQGTDLKIKFNLTTDGGETSTPLLKGYAVSWWE